MNMNNKRLSKRMVYASLRLRGYETKDMTGGVLNPFTDIWTDFDIRRPNIECYEPLAHIFYMNDEQTLEGAMDRAAYTWGSLISSRAALCFIFDTKGKKFYSLGVKERTLTEINVFPTPDELLITYTRRKITEGFRQSTRWQKYPRYLAAKLLPDKVVLKYA
jgi:hypothetical protein